MPSQSINSVASVRVRRKRNDDEDALEEFYTLVTHIPVLPGGYKGLETQPAEDE